MVQTPRERVQDFRLEAVVPGVLADLGGVECCLHLVGQGRHDEGEEEGDQREERQVVDEDADRSRYSDAREALDAGSHCGGDREPKEE